MGLLDQLNRDGTVSLSPPQLAVLIGVLAVAVSLVAVGLQPGDQVGPLYPQAEWTWSTTGDGDVALTHEGGASIDRESLRLTGDALAGTVSDLGHGGDPRLVRPFGDPVVSRGDSLVIDGDALEEGHVALRWHATDSDQSATLASLQYPDDFDGAPRSTIQQ